MPLQAGKSKAAFAHNVRAEVAAGKPQRQGVAIAYKEAGEKRKPKEIGIPKTAPKAIKKADEAYDKKHGLKEGSKEDLKADRRLMKTAKKGRK